MGHKYLITGSTIINDIVYADGSKVTGILGGTIYTVNGVRPYCDDLLFISVAGPDFDNYYGDYFRKNSLDMSGVEIVLPKTSYTTVEYSETGQWWEHSIYGEEYERAVGVSPQVQSQHVVKHATSDTKGIYFESSVNESVWQGLEDIRAAAPNAVIMAELSTRDIDTSSMNQAVFDLIDKTDMYSINLPESKTLFGTNREEESIERIIALKKPCFLRVGTKGSYMIQDGAAYFAPSVGAEKSVDATGCGNCSTGAAMYGYCEGMHPLKTAIIANLAAGLNAKQYGPYDHFTDKLRAELLSKADEIFEDLKV